MKKITSFFRFVLPVLLLVGSLFIGANHASAAVTVSVPSNGTISADKSANATSPAYTSLNDIKIDENLNNDFADTGSATTTLILTAPSGWEFNAGVGSVTFTGGRNITSGDIIITTSIITVSIKVSGVNRDDKLTIKNIEVRAIDGASLPSAGNILRTSDNPGTAIIAGISNDSTNFASLSQIVGAHSKFGVIPSITSPTTDNTFTVTLIAQDQFGNTVTSYTGTKNVTWVFATGGTNSPAGNPAVKAVNGNRTFTSGVAATIGDFKLTKAGEPTTIQATASTKSGISDIIVATPGVLDHINISPSNAQVLTSGSTLQFSAQGFDVNDNPISDLTFTWTVVPDTETGSIDSNGLFTANNSGTITVTATNDTKIGTSGIITINKADSTTVVTCPATPQTYTGLAQTPCTVLVTGTDGLSLTPDPIYTNNTNAGIDTASASYTFDGDENHNGSTDTKTFSISKANATIVVTPYSVTYDGNPHTATGSVTGVLGEDLSADLDLSDTTHTSAGSYPTDAWTYAGDSNYNPDSGIASDSIERADAVCTITGYSAPYDALAHGATGSCLGVEGEQLSGLDLGSTFANVPGGTANWTFADVTGNYNNTSGNVSIEILALNLTVTADAKSKTYGDSDPDLTYAITSGSLVGADNFSGTLSRDAGEDVGSYAINQNTLVLSENYNLTYVGNTFSVSPQATLTVTADDKLITYGDSDPSFTFAYSGFKNSDDAGVIDTLPTCSVSENHSNVGAYGIVCSGGADNNYAFSYDSGTLTVNAKAITVTADAKSKIYGDPDPDLTYTNDPLVGADILTGALERVAGENVGAYAINQGTVNNVNYNITYIGADLTINKANQTITFNALSDKAVNSPDFTVSATTSSELPVTFTVGAEDACTISENTIHLTGEGACTVTAHQDGNSNYNPADNVSRSFAIITTKTITTDEENTTTTSTDAGEVAVDIPASTNATGPLDWDGIIAPPTVTTVFTAPTPGSGFASTTPVIALEMGAGDIALTFDKAVKITFAGQADKYVGWSRGGVFTEITATCDDATNPTLGAGADCKINVGSDLVVWTKHFTTFITYTQKSIPSGSGGLAEQSSQTIPPPVISEVLPPAPVSQVLGASTETPAPAGKVLGAEKFNFTLSLKKGSKGAEVIELQKFLSALGYTLVVDGKFGPKTKAAVIKFQIANNLKGDGIVGSKVRALLNK